MVNPESHCVTSATRHKNGKFHARNYVVNKHASLCSSAHLRGAVLWNSVCFPVSSRGLQGVRHSQGLGRILRFLFFSKGPFIYSVTRDAAFFDLDLPPPPSSRSLSLKFRRVTLFFTAVRFFSVYFGLASRPSFAVCDCVTLESFLRFTPSPNLVT